MQRRHLQALFTVLYFITVLCVADAAAIAPLKPVMGYSNWYDTKCDVHAERFLEAADALEKTGLKSLGYTQINVDAGWALPHRDNKTRQLVADPRFFPKGMDGLATVLKGRGFQLGGYTDRGTQQCGPSPGSKGASDNPNTHIPTIDRTSNHTNTDHS